MFLCFPKTIARGACTATVSWPGCASRCLPNVPADHKCGRMHGHGFEVILHASIDLGARDIGVDYDHIDACWAPIHALLDHACLNDIAELENPTSELLASWIWKRLKATLAELPI